jgi:hypothetical protein
MAVLRKRLPADRSKAIRERIYSRIIEPDLNFFAGYQAVRKGVPVRSFACRCGQFAR